MRLSFSPEIRPALVASILIRLLIFWGLLGALLLAHRRTPRGDRPASTRAAVLLYLLINLAFSVVQVDAYVVDPWCGFDTPPETVPMLFGQAARLADPDVLTRIRPDLAVLVASGQDDPLSGGGALVELLAQRYRDAGLTDVTLLVYPDARHEIFNETNRDEVTAAVVDWLSRHV